MNKERKWLTLAGVFTWALVAYVELERLWQSSSIWISCLGYVVFLLCLIAFTSGYCHRYAPRVGKLLLFAQLFIALALLTVHHGSVAPVLLVVWAGQLPEAFSRKLAIFQVLISSLTFYTIMEFAWTDTSPLITSLIYLGFQLFALSSSFSRVSEHQARERAEFLNQQLQATRVLLAQSSRQDERMRIARDLHDILGHQLTALNLQLEILHHTVPQAQRESVAQTKALAKELLENIRAVVRDQRNSFCVDINQAVQALLAHIPQVKLTIVGTVQLDSVRLAEQLVLCVQEGISNALRHGKATQLKLTLEQGAGLITLLLDDNGRGLLGTMAEGSGLIGMRERLRDYAGVVSLQAQQLGCRLSISCATKMRDAAHD